MVRSTGIILMGSKRTQTVREEVPLPVGTQVLIRTHTVGLCGSDISLYEGTYEGPQNYPIYFGHEWSGTVEAVGSEVTRVRPGDKVTGDCSIFCGACEFCAEDPNLCQSIEKFGITINGASREYFLQEERYIYRAAPEAALDLVALSEPLAVGAHAVRRVREARPRLRHEKILILGGGTIGLSCLFALKYIEGCEHVELYDVVEARVKKAAELGASPLTDVVCADLSSASYSELYCGVGYDVIIETTASPAAFERAVGLIRPLGTTMALGFIPKVELSLKQITLKAARIMGSIGGTGDFEPVLAFIARYPHLARQLITHQLPYTDSLRAFEVAKDRKNSLKVLVQF